MVGIPQKATDLNVSACEARPNRDLPLVSVRTLIPLAEYVRARLSPWERGSMRHRATQLILPFEPGLPGRQLILAPRLWPTITPTTQQQLAKRVAQLLRS